MKKVWFNEKGHRADIGWFKRDEPAIVIEEGDGPLAPDLEEVRKIPANVAAELAGCRMLRYTKERIPKEVERKAAEEEARIAEADPDGEVDAIMDGGQVAAAEEALKKKKDKKKGKEVKADGGQ